MLKKFGVAIIMFFILAINSNMAYSASSTEQSYTTIGVVDYKTFNEYRYKITDQYLDLRNKFEVEGKIDAYTAARILFYAKEGLNYLPDSLINKNYYNYLKSSIEKGVKYPENSSIFEEIATSIENYLEKVNIQKITGSVESFPSTGNAPLTVTLRGDVKDPTGTQLDNHNYTWWINDGGKRKVIGNKVSMTYVFKEEGNFSVFLDVSSNHKNASGYSDVLPFSSRADIVVKEKVASIILKVNSDNLGQQEELKFLPDDAKYGLLFDATSSTPTSGTKFIKTEWDFGHGVTRVNDGGPNVERVVYAGEGDFTVKLKLTTNENKSVERKFTLKIHNPIATIKTTSEEGYLGDKFTFTANPTGSNTNLTYAWKIIDIKNDKELLNKSASTFTHTFTEKGKYNVKLFVTDSSGNTDVDYKIIHINSRAPEAKYVYSIPYSNKPNTVFLDATSSFDADFSDDGKLTFSWIINGERVNLDSPNYNGSNGYYTFSSVGEQSVVLEVTDPDDMTSQNTQKISIKSILSVEFFAFPRVVQREKPVRLVADSPKASFYEWNFGDGKNEGGKSETISHTYNKSGVYLITLKVIDDNDNTNTFSKNVYVGDTDEPFAFISLKDNKLNNVSYQDDACNGEGAYIVDRVETFTFSGDESLDVTGENTGLSYSWKLGNSIYNTQNFTKKFDELGCSKVKLSVKSSKNGKESTKEVNVKVENLKPTLSSLNISVKDIESDPVLVSINAIGSKDLDGVIQSYLWYYYTDLDPEPQDFRATKTESTTFVLPKVTGNYYFVVVMKDNNEARSNSQDINGSKYFITLTGDNVNTPIVDLNVNNSSVSIGDEVVFTANAENILGQSLNSKVTFSWDFDGDGFYDKETSTNSVAYKYEASGEKFAKVKVKYKGFSNTKTVTMNVANVLKPDFEYISIGNDFVFLDNSLGNATSYLWDMGDGNKITKQGGFSYTYTDGNSSHIVSLKISESTKSKEISKKVVKDLSNFIKARKGGLIVFSNQVIDENDTITLKEKIDNLYLYLGASSGNIANYVADFDINYDSDLNGGSDDDEDNKFQDSYASKNAILVELNNSKEQIIRLYTKDSSGKLIDSKDIKVIKEYIEEVPDINTIIFEGVSDNIKLKLEKVKLAVSNFPKEYKLKGLMYVQNLKDEWNDNREKTNIIIEFEGFIEESNISNGKELIDLLESLLIEGETDKSEKSIAFNALKNLIPVDIKCDEKTLLEITDEKLTCYDVLIAKLEVIGENSNIDENKELGKVILENIATDELMTVKEKTDFKAILNTFVYGGISNIPDEVKDPVISNNTSGSSGGILDIFLGILKIIFLIILGVTGIIGLFFIYYKLVNEDKNISFVQFVGDKTSGKKNKIKQDEKVEDILGVQESDIFSDENEFDFNKDFSTNDDLSINSDLDTKSTKLEDKTTSKPETTEIKETKSEIPDWLKGSFSEDPMGDIEEKDSIKKVDSKDILEQKNDYIDISNDFDEPKSNIEIKDETEFKETKSEIPDWLKGSFDYVEETKVETETNIEEPEAKVEEPRLETKEELDDFTKLEVEEDTPLLDDSKLPDWLKGSFDTEEKKEEKKENKNEEKPEEETKTKKDDFLDVLIQDNNNDSVEKKFDDESKKIVKKLAKKPSPKKINKVEEIKKEETKVQTDETSKNNSDSELWDDGMKIPDWLKTDDDK
ncbi:MAG: PKD domain-containing protein [Candidatus Gracilibacteria bacterium]|nr:PKD domain-containing protein [Candidatus Gracilibacteria bacterium]